ncbi:MAG: VOC family protein [Thermoflexales bacterium]
MLKLSSVLIGTKQLSAMAGFYEKVLERPADMSAEGFSGWQLGGAFFGVFDHSEMGGNAKDPGRVMFNLETSQVKEETERIRALGGPVVHEPYEGDAGWIATFSDPDGNYFQLMSPIPAG